MKRLLYTLCLLLFCSAVTWGQLPAATKAMATSVAEKAFLQASRQSLPAVIPLRTAAALSQESQLALPLHKIDFNQLEHTIRKSVFTVQGHPLMGMAKINASGFVFEEEYEGETFLWGLVSQHLINMAGSHPTVLFWFDNQEIKVRVKVVARGSQNFADMALVRLPKNIRKHIVPLKLAEVEPVTGQIAESYGFYEDRFGHTENREILDVSPARIITTYNFGFGPRAGACGGPLLINGLVVGVHCGSSVKQGISHAVNITQVKDLLAASRNKGIALRDLKINGRPFGTINIDQSISKINVFENNKLLTSFDLRKREHLVDYNQLEKIIPLEGATDVYIELSRDNFLTTRTRQKDLALSKTILHYNVATGDSRPLSYTRKLLYTYFNVLD